MPKKRKSKNEGKDHINISSQSKHWLGVFLSFEHKSNFEHEKYGKFQSLLHFESWLRTGKLFDALREGSAYDIRLSIKLIPLDFIPNKTILNINDKSVIEEIKPMIEKIIYNDIRIVKGIERNELPLDYYFPRGGLCFPMRQRSYYLKEILRIEREIKLENEKRSSNKN